LPLAHFSLFSAAGEVVNGIEKKFSKLSEFVDAVFYGTE